MLTVFVFTPSEGAMELTAGAGNSISNPFVSVPALVSELVTTTFHDPAVAPSRLNVQVIFDGDTTVTPVAVITSEDPDRVRFTFAPGWNPVPLSSAMEMGQPRLPEAGVMELTVGAGAVISNPLVSVYTCPSGLVTTTFHVSAVFSFRSNVQVICSGETTVTSFPVIYSEDPRVSFTFALGWNPVPVRAMPTGQPRFPEVGMMPVMESGSYTMNGLDVLEPQELVVVS
jgi:hypothetical protein